VGVFVVGMHRSGTSAVAAALEALGLDVGDPERLMVADAGNPAGYYEQQEISDLNDEMLSVLGGTWDCPPKLNDGWELEPAMAPYYRRAASVISTRLDKKRWLVKDPRITLLLPLWRRAVLDRGAAVLVVRDPMEVAWSLALRNAMPILTGLALWAEYNRAALIGLSGLPVYVCNYDELVVDPVASMTSLRASLETWNEIPADADAAAAVAAAAARVRPELRRNTWPRDNADALEVPVEIERLVKFMADLDGGHAVWEPGPPPASPWEHALLTERRSAATRYRIATTERDAALQLGESLGHQLHARNLEFDALVQLARTETERAEEFGHDLDAARKRIHEIEADLAGVQTRRRAAEKEARESERRLQMLERSRLLRVSRALKQLRRSLFGSS
jgi:hypothetical protein